MPSLSKVLCVDDEPDIRTILTAALKFTMQVEVVAVGSAREAFEYLEENELPDLIILDGMMPEMDGLTACKRLRADPRYDGIPIVFLTAKARPSEQQRALEAGATACLSKPFDPMAVGQQILGALQKAGTQP